MSLNSWVPTFSCFEASWIASPCTLGVVRLNTAQQRLAWLAEHLGEFDGSGIIYCLTVSATREVADFLSERGHLVAAYSGQTEAGEREGAGSRPLIGPRQGTRGHECTRHGV